MGPRHPREFPRQCSQGGGSQNAPSRGPGVPPGCLGTPILFLGGPTGIPLDDVGRYSHRCSSPLSTVDFVPPSDYMYMGVPPIYGEHPRTIPRPVQMVGKLATPFDPVLTPRLVIPTPTCCQHDRFLSAAQPFREPVQTPTRSPLDLDSPVQGSDTCVNAHSDSAESPPAFCRGPSVHPCPCLSFWRRGGRG